MPDEKLVLFSKGKFEKVDVKLSNIRLWRKEVLRFGQWIHPEDKSVKFDITPDVVQQVVANFNAGVPDVSPIVLTHTDDPRAKVGRVKSFVVTETGLDAIMTVDDDGVNGNIDSGEKAPGVSCWLSMNYQHKESGDKIGAVVKHVALVNHPYIEGMKGFEAVLSDAEEADKDSVPLIFLSEKKKTSKEELPMNKDELIKELKEKHEVDVTALLSDSEGLKALQKMVEDVERIEPIKLSDELTKAIRERLKLSESDDINVIDVLTSTFATKKDDDQKKDDPKLIAALSEIETLKKENAEAKADKAVDVLFSEGYLFPKEKESYKKLYLSDVNTFNTMVEARKASGKVLNLSEEGTQGGDTESDDDVLKRNVEAAKDEGSIAK